MFLLCEGGRIPLHSKRQRARPRHRHADVALSLTPTCAVGLFEGNFTAIGKSVPANRFAVEQILQADEASSRCTNPLRSHISNTPSVAFPVSHSHSANGRFVLGVGSSREAEARHWSG
jgi:hypothetical protein